MQSAATRVQRPASAARSPQSCGRASFAGRWQHTAERCATCAEAAERGPSAAAAAACNTTAAAPGFANGSPAPQPGRAGGWVTAVVQGDVICPAGPQQDEPQTGSDDSDGDGSSEGPRARAVRACASLLAAKGDAIGCNALVLLYTRLRAAYGLGPARPAATNRRDSTDGEGGAGDDTLEGLQARFDAWRQQWLQLVEHQQQQGQGAAHAAAVAQQKGQRVQTVGSEQGAQLQQLLHLQQRRRQQQQQQQQEQQERHQGHEEDDPSDGAQWPQAHQHQQQHRQHVPPGQRRQWQQRTSAWAQLLPRPPFNVVWAALASQTLARAGQLRPKDWSQVLYTCAKIRRARSVPDSALVAAALRCTHGLQAEMGAAALSNAVWAVAVLGAPPPDGWLEGACVAAAAVLGVGAPAPASAVAAAVAAGAVAAEAAAVEPGAAGAPTAGAAAAQAAAAGTSELVDSGEFGSKAVSQSGLAARPSRPPSLGRIGTAPFNHHQAVQLLWALGALRHRAPAPLIAALLARLVPALPQLAPSELTNTAWALAQLRFRPAGAWVDTYLSATQNVLRRTGDGDGGAGASSNGGGASSSIGGAAGLCAPQLSTMLASLAVLHVSPPPTWHSAMRSALLWLAPDMRPRQLGLIMCSLAKLRQPLAPYWLGLLAGRVEELLLQQHAAPAAPGAAGGGAAARQRHAAAARGARPPPMPWPFTDADLAAIVWALPLLAYPDTRVWAASRTSLLRVLAAASLPRLGRMALPQLVQLAVGFSRLGFHPGVQWVKSHENACASHYGGVDRANRARLRAAFSAFWVR